VVATHGPVTVERIQVGPKAGRLARGGCPVGSAWSALNQAITLTTRTALGRFTVPEARAVSPSSKNRRKTLASHTPASRSVVPPVATSRDRLQTPRSESYPRPWRRLFWLHLDLDNGNLSQASGGTGSHSGRSRALGERHPIDDLSSGRVVDIEMILGVGLRPLAPDQIREHDGLNVATSTGPG